MRVRVFSWWAILIIFLICFCWVNGVGAAREAGEMDRQAEVIRQGEGVYSLIGPTLTDYYELVAGKERITFTCARDSLNIIIRFLQHAGMQEPDAVNEALEMWWVLELGADTEGKSAYWNLEKRGIIGPRFSLVVGGKGGYVYDMRIYGERIGTNPEWFREKGVPTGCLIRAIRVMIDLAKDKPTIICSTSFIVTDDGQVYEESDPMFLTLKGVEESSWRWINPVVPDFKIYKPKGESGTGEGE